jgi:hypothetical protein
VSDHLRLEFDVSLARVRKAPLRLVTKEGEQLQGIRVATT